ncbi:MAG: GNAT family N-acetyltransferase [Paracoccaceae bacterium]
MNAKTEIIIRPKTARDDAVLVSLLLPVFRVGDTYTVDPDISETAALAFWTAPEKSVFIAEQGGEVVGTYYIRPNQAGGGAHICNCGYITATAAQGRGIARTMLAHSLQTARAEGYRGMQYNFVVSENRRAVATWQKAGFEIVGRLPQAFDHPSKGLVDALVMFKSLMD